MSMRSKILVVEDHPMVAESFATYLGVMHDVVGVAFQGRDALALAEQEQPEIILLDIALGPESGFALAPSLLERAPSAAIVFLTQHNNSDFQSIARTLGASGFIGKSEPWSAVLEALELIGGGGTWYSRAEEESPYIASRVDRSVHLTVRQIEVLENLERGLTYKEIGNAMSLSENTIDVYLRRVRSILGGHKAVDLVRLARQHGFLPRRLVTNHRTGDARARSSAVDR
jgi:DNA-binding NarL/FixJ family response regulator